MLNTCRSRTHITSHPTTVGTNRYMLHIKASPNINRHVGHSAWPLSNHSWASTHEQVLLLMRHQNTTKNHIIRQAQIRSNYHIFPQDLTTPQLSPSSKCHHTSHTLSAINAKWCINQPLNAMWTQAKIFKQQLRNYRQWCHAIHMHIFICWAKVSEALLVDTCYTTWGSVSLEWLGVSVYMNHYLSLLTPTRVTGSTPTTSCIHIIVAVKVLDNTAEGFRT